MVAGLNVSRLIRVQATIAPLAVPLKNFGIPLFVDSTPGVIDTVERIREYASLEEVAGDWPTTSGAYLGAQAFFGQEPQPALCYIGFWAQGATSGVLHGSLLSAAQQLLSNFTVVSSGDLNIAIDGTPYTLTGIDLHAQLNINGVAAVIQSDLRTAGAAGCRVVWNAVLGRFDIFSGSIGTPSSVAFATAPLITPPSSPSLTPSTSGG